MTSSTQRNLLFLAVGDVHGHWDHVIEAIALAEQRCGERPDLVLQVGDAGAYRNNEDLAGAHLPSKYRTLGDFSALQPGDLLTPVYFIGGNHEPYVALDALTGPFPVEWEKGVRAFYLGRAGAAPLDNGIRVAWLSGIFSPEVTTGRRDGSRRSRSYFLVSDAEETLSAAAELGDIDVLVTHDWPSGVGATRAGAPAGNTFCRELVEEIQPRLHICGHMHIPLECSIGNTVVHGLNAVPKALAGKPGPRGQWWRLYRLAAPDRSVTCIAVAC